jgi:hypothetical protein
MGARGYALEVYAAKGLASRLHAAFVQQVLTAFATAGYFVEAQEEKVVDGEVRTRYLLKDGLGRPALPPRGAEGGGVGLRLWQA